jgi:DNA-binding XRE family transcriptional regulator
MCDGWPAGPAPSGMLSRCSRTSEHDDVARVAGFGLAQPWPARFQVFTTGRACLILALAGSECVVRVLIEADIDAEIGARLAEVRRRCGLTQRQLAKAVGVQLTTVQNWERGRTGLPAKRLAALANALHCQPIDLLMLPGTGVTPRTPGEGDISPAPRQPWPGEPVACAALPRKPAAE